MEAEAPLSSREGGEAKKSIYSRKSIVEKGKARAKKERDKEEIRRLELKALQGDTFSPVWRFLKANAIRFKTIAEAVWYIPFDFLFHFFNSISTLFLLIIIGILWIMVWAVVEEVAMYAKNDILVPLFVVIEGLIALLDLMLDWIMLYIFGPILMAIQAVICESGLIRVFQMSSKVKHLICDAPGFANPFPVKFISYDQFISGFWDELKNIKNTCAEFSTGIEVLQVMFKLIFSPYICPVIKHTRPVPWLHSMFYYLFGWMSWEVGIRASYEDPLARAVTGHKETNGIAGNTNCNAPPDAFLCFMMGIGFLIIEILVPLIIILFIIVPLKRIIFSCFGIAFSIIYHTLAFIIYYTEKLFSSLNWAGKEWAWAIVAALPILISTLVGFFVYDLVGLSSGAVLGAIIGSTMAASRGANFFNGPDKIFDGPGSIAIYGITFVVTIVIALPPLIVDLTSNRDESQLAQSSEWIQ